MKTKQKPGRRQWLAVWAAVALLAALSIFLRAGAGDRKLYINEDATWHVLHTMDSYDGIPAAEHLCLPLVTENDDARGIVWGATVPDKDGLFYYTSFWPLGFLAPYLFANITGLPHLPGTLFAFNAVLYVAGAVLLALAMARLFRDRLNPALATFCAAGLYLFQPEILQSQGWVYWHHGLNQVLLLAQFYCFACFDKRVGKIGFFVLCLLTPLAEYTGFVANAGYCLALVCLGPPQFWGMRGTRKKASFAKSRLLPALGAGLLTVAAGAGTLWHYTRKLPFKQVWRAMFQSYEARGDAEQGPLLQLAVMYFRSFRWLWLILALLAVAVLVLPGARRALPGVFKACWKWLLLAVFPLLENLILRQHTMEYSYARMKGILPLAVLFLMLAACLWQAESFKRTGDKKPNWQRAVAGALAALTLLGGAAGLAQYLAVPNRYVEVIDYKDENAALAAQVLAAYPRDESFYGFNLPTRGYTNHLWAGGVMELCKAEDTLAEAQARGKAYAVQLAGEWATSNTYRFTGAVVYDAQSGAVLAEFFA
ncbi:hypothetical protein LJC60_05740 [Ruminococcaceae bacterium OttesenSCG-928-D13]|nr:hypothetical protein [Ruminococcaceae bacterium OttesenSCG-928-D13]